MKINVVKSVLDASDQLAKINRARMDAAGVLSVNILSAPGSGKTTLLERTLPALGESRSAVLVGDLQTTRDAERLEAGAAEVLQINTGKGCHLSPGEVADGLGQLELAKVDYLFIDEEGLVNSEKGEARSAKIKGAVKARSEVMPERLSEDSPDARR